MTSVQILHNLVVEHEIQPGETRSIDLTISKSYSGADVRIPVIVIRGQKDGPSVAITAAIHGDELNGTGVIRHILTEAPFELKAGTLLLVPVINILGFERHSRYMPDRRDLNRSFPGARNGSLASRMAREFFDKVIRECDYGIDLHTAAVRRTNFPNVRADMSNPELADFARAFGAELIVNGKGPKGSLRLAANKAGCKTLILEAGEVWKVEPGVVEYALRGISNCLTFLNMIEAESLEPAYRLEVDSTSWLRARDGGFLQFHVRPGDTVNKGDAIATNYSLSGAYTRTVRANRHGIILGMTTLPAVVPGSPVCHIAFTKASTPRQIDRVTDNLPADSLYERVKDEVGSAIMVHDDD